MSVESQRRAWAARLVLVAAAVAAAGVECAQFQYQTLARNLIIVGAAAIVLLSNLFINNRILDISIPRRRWLTPACAAALAIVSLWPTLQMPYLADDWQLLETRGARPFWWTMFGRDEGEPWFRPVGWAPWWLFDKISNTDATFARAICILLFSLCAAQVGPALRRCGAPRGIAAAAGCIFAVSPAAFETVAWITNLYAVLALLFSLTAIIKLPFGRRTIRNMAVPCTLALCAFLSKEDSYLLPIWIAAAFARFRPRLAWRGFVAALPFFIIVAIVATIRARLVGGLGAYQEEATGQSTLVRRMFYGPRLALTTEMPSNYLLPLRMPPVYLLKRILWWSIPTLLFMFGGISGATRRCLPRGIFIFALTIAPIAPLLPIGPRLDCARWLFAPTVGLSFIAASLLVSSPLRGRLAWIPVGGFIILSFIATRSNLYWWETSSNVMNRSLELAKPIVDAVPAGSRIFMIRAPWMVEGSYCYNCATPFVYHRALVRRMNYLEPQAATGPLDRMIEFDLRGDKVLDYLSVEEAPRLAVGETLRIDLYDAASKNVHITNLYNISRDAAVGTVFRAGLPGMILFPTIQFEPGSRLKCESDVRYMDGESRFGLLVYVTFSSDDKYHRMQIPLGEAVRLPPSVDHARLDLVVPFGESIQIKNFNILVEK